MKSFRTDDKASLTTSQRNINALAAIYRDLSSIDHYSADDIVLHTADGGASGRPALVTGKAEVRAHEVGLIGLTHNTLSMDVQDIVANEYFGSVTGTLRASHGGVHIGMPFCGLWRFRDGKIVEHWENAYDAQAFGLFLARDLDAPSVKPWICAPDAQQLMTLVTGFWAAKTLAVAHELGVFNLLSSGNAVTIEQYAKLSALHPRPAEMLLTACAALGLLKQSDECYVNSELAETFLVKGRPQYFGGWIEMADRREYPAWMRLKHALETNAPLTWDPAVQTSLFDGEDPALLEGFWEAMYSLSITTPWTLASDIDLSDMKRLLDVGGGGAANDITLCGRYPELHATVFDLPHVCVLTRSKIEAVGLSDRITVVEGDFFNDPTLPTGYDVILLSKILLDWPEADCRLIIGKCFNALPDGGRIIIADLFVDDTKDGPADAALMSLNMLVETWGRNYTSAEYRAWLSDAGFIDLDTVRFNAPSANGLVIGFKSASRGGATC
jgi:3-hydroxy-5-methyl-1-naphthoate 3-O-methyltransferase